MSPVPGTWSRPPTLALVAARLTCLLLSLSASGAAPAIELRLPDQGLRLSELAGQIGEYSWSAREIVLHGRLAPHRGGARGVLEVAARGVAAHDASYLHAAEGLRIDGTVEIVDASDDAAVLRVDLLLGAGEILVDQLYVDLALFPMSLAGRFEIPLSGDGEPAWIRVSEAKIAVAGVGHATGSGRVRSDGAEVEIDATVDVDGLSRLYDVLRGPAGDLPESRIETRGRMTVDLQYRQSALQGYSLRGELRVRDAAVFGTDPVFRLRGIHVDLPISLGTADGGDHTGAGRIEIAQSTVWSAEIGAAEIALEVGRNRLRLVAPVRLPIFGGALVLRAFDASRLVTTARRAVLALDVESVDLDELSRGLGIPRLKGSLSASIPEMEITAGALRSNGEVTADVFGGRVRVRDIRGDGLATTVPTFGFELDFDDVLLEQVTRTFAFGYVSGAARGGVRDLEFVSWGPVSFEAWLETFPADGVSQALSVTAINQITALGGGVTTPLTTGIMGFFDEYRYSKLGFRCELHNDVFELEGIEVRDGRHYLVVGSTLPPRVNVISHVREIAFSEMMSRIERVLSAPRTTQQP